MMRTSLSLPKPLYNQLQVLAEQRKSNVSEIIRNLLEKILAAEQNEKQKKMYAQLSKMKGMGNKGITDASTTIDATLYSKSNETSHDK